MAYFNEDVQVVRAFLVNLGADETGSGTISDLNSNQKSQIRITNATALNSIVAVDDKLLTIINATSGALNIINETGTTAANRIITGRNGDLTLPVNGCIQLYYDKTSARWRITSDNTPPITQNATTFTVSGSGTVHYIDTNINYAQAGFWTAAMNVQTNLSGSLTVRGQFGYNSGTFFSQDLNITGILNTSYTNNSGKVRITVTTLLSNSTFNVVGNVQGQYN